MKAIHIGAPRATGDLPLLSERLASLVRDGDADLLVCDLAGLADADCGTVEALARLQLTARRLGRRIRLEHPSPQLHQLLALVGLCDVVGACPDLGLEAQGQAEEREHPLGVQEERDPADPAV